MENLKNKMVEQVKQLAEKGYSYFYFGVESGDDNGEEVLQRYRSRVNSL